MRYSFLAIQALFFSVVLWLMSCGGTSVEQSTIAAPQAPIQEEITSAPEEVVEEDPLAVDNLLEFKVSEDPQEPQEEVKLTKAEKTKLKKCKEAYADAKMYLGTPDEELKIWKKFVKDYPGKDNPYLDEAKAKIQGYENPKQNVALPTRSKEK
jgi:hypothetical protein